MRYLNFEEYRHK